MKEDYDIHPYIESIYRFCASKIHDPYDAEDLAGEILLHIMDGMRKYEIDTLEHWIWRVAHNRYARFIAEINQQNVISSEKIMFDLADDLNIEDDFVKSQKQNAVYKTSRSGDGRTTLGPMLHEYIISEAMHALGSFCSFNVVRF